MPGQDQRRQGTQVSQRRCLHPHHCWTGIEFCPAGLPPFPIRLSSNHHLFSMGAAIPHVVSQLCTAHTTRCWFRCLWLPSHELSGDDGG